MSRSTISVIKWVLFGNKSGTSRLRLLCCSDQTIKRNLLRELLTICHFHSNSTYKMNIVKCLHRDYHLSVQHYMSMSLIIDDTMKESGGRNMFAHHRLGRLGLLYIYVIFCDGKRELLFY